MSASGAVSSKKVSVSSWSCSSRSMAVVACWCNYSLIQQEHTHKLTMQLVIIHSLYIPAVSFELTPNVTMRIALWILSECVFSDLLGHVRWWIICCIPEHSDECSPFPPEESAEVVKEWCHWSKVKFHLYSIFQFMFPNSTDLYLLSSSISLLMMLKILHLFVCWEGKQTDRWADRHMLTEDIDEIQRVTCQSELRYAQGHFLCLLSYQRSLLLK